jgi:hypothetical protein
LIEAKAAPDRRTPGWRSITGCLTVFLGLRRMNLQQQTIVKTDS